MGNQGTANSPRGNDDVVVDVVSRPPWQKLMARRGDKNKGVVVVVDADVDDVVGRPIFANFADFKTRREVEEED